MNERIRDWFASRGWTPFAFQEEVWEAYLAGEDGLLHAPTGTGKTQAVWLGPVMEWMHAHGSVESGEAAPPITALWITPLRALANDTVEALRAPVEALGLPWRIEKRTGDTSSTVKTRQRKRLPTALVTTPESASLLLSYKETARQFRSLRCLVVDEWHELIGTKRGVQTELVRARLRRMCPELRTWGLSATLGDLDLAKRSLLGSDAARGGRLVSGDLQKDIEIETLLPDSVERFPWAGHIGLKLLDGVLERIESARSTLLFTNTRSQTEIWHRAILNRRPDLMEQVAIHHGSIDRRIRTRVEDMLRAGELKCAVCTSSLDLGVDFSPVEQVIQVGSPKGIGRLMQRAGRSGHQPGVPSRIVGVPTHALELIEFAAVRDALVERRVEPRTPLRLALDVLAQHVVTIALGGGFTEPDLLAEARTTHAFADLTVEQWGWVMDFVTRGGPALTAYPQYARVGTDETGRHVIASPQIGRLHRMAIGTISSDTAMLVRFVSGKSLGTIEESFISRLNPGDRFVFSGRVLELVRVRDMTAQVKVAKNKKGAVPRWGGGKMPLSTQLSEAVRSKFEESKRGAVRGPEMEVVSPLLELQDAVSLLPQRHELLIERTKSREGHHWFVFPFEGRLAQEGLGALLAHRVTRAAPRSVTATATDYGIELLSAAPIELDEAAWRSLLSTDELLDDLLACLNSTQLARRRFRDIARVAGLLMPGYPGSGKSARQLQASSDLFYDVFQEFDPENMLLHQARREVLEEQLEVRRLREALERIATLEFAIVETERLSPLAFPIYAERLRAEHLSTEQWSDRMAKMAVQLERASERSGNIVRR